MQKKMDASIHQLEAVPLAPDSVEPSTIRFFSIHRQVLSWMPSIFWALKRISPERKKLLDSGQAYWKIAHRCITGIERWIAEDDNVIRMKLGMEKISIVRYTMMWCAANCFPPPQDFWTQVYALYQHVEQDAYKSTTTSRACHITLHKSSLQHEFNHLLALSVCALDAMRSDEIFHASTIVENLARYLVISTVCGAQDRFMLTLNEPLAPRVIPAKLPPNAPMLFFGIPDFATHLARVPKPAKEMAMIHDSVLRLLQEQWSLHTAHRRKHERQKISIQAHIVISRSPVLSIVSLSPQHFHAYRQKKRITLAAEAASTVQITDISIGGFGLQLEDFEATPLIVGSLIALHMPEATTWRIGLVKRIRRLDKNAFLGIQLISSEPILSDLTLADGNREPAIILPDCIKGNGNATGVILADQPPDHFKNSVITLMTDEYMRRMVPDTLWHHGPDYTLWGYKQIANEETVTHRDTVIDPWFSSSPLH